MHRTDFLFRILFFFPSILMYLAVQRPHSCKKYRKVCLDQDVSDNLALLISAAMEKFSLRNLVSLTGLSIFFY